MMETATDKSTVQFVLRVLAFIDVLLWCFLFALLWRLIGITDVEQRTWGLAAVATIASGAVGTLGVIGGMLINTRTVAGAVPPPDAVPAEEVVAQT